MKVLMAVLAYVAVVAAGGVASVADHPDEQPLAPLAANKTIRLFTSSEQPLVPVPGQLYGVRKVLKGILVVAIKDASNDHMNAYLLPKGLKHFDSNLEELRPLTQFMFNGRKKAFLCLDAACTLGLPEMAMPLKEIRVPTAYTLNKYLPISTNPYVILVDYDSISGSSRFAGLKELAEFRVEREGLRLVRDNYPQLFQG